MQKRQSPGVVLCSEKPMVTSGVRIGTPAVTTRGFGTDEMVKVASFIERVAFGDEAARKTVTDEVLDLCAKVPIYAD